MQKLLLLLLFIGATITSEAQFNRYIIKLRDKGSNPYSISTPSAYLSDRALQRRQRYQISIDSLDLPVTPRYIDSIRLAGNVTILNTSKWLNQVAIRTNDAAALAKINSFAFVSSTRPIGSREITHRTDKFQLENMLQDTSVNSSENITAEDHYSYGKSNGQVKIHKGEFLHNHGFRGEGMLMAVLDAGFFRFTTLPTFDSVRNNNQILGTWDFVNNEMSVDEDNSHGMQCLSTIAANMPGLFVGTAPKTHFYLFRTEDVASEYPIEEQNWVAGMERSDSLGVDITSTSLGYYQFDNATFDYTYADMNGRTTISARGANIAARKGMMVVTAAGNEGNGAWHYIITPSDADSAIAVGAVDTLGNVASFSSYGPASDGRMKPDLSAVGWNAVVANTNTGLPAFGSGTSFACPNLAGIITCLWQAFPEVNNMGIIAAMKASATKGNNPDVRVGWGIPDVKKSFVLLLRQSYQQNITNSNCMNTLSIAVKSDATMPVIIERKLPGQTSFTTLTTLNNTGNFLLNNFTYQDDVTGFAAGNIQYRIRMDIAADTSFFLDSLSIASSGSCLPPDNSLTVGPNPVRNNLLVKFTRTTDVNYQIMLHNSAGQKIFATKGIQRAGIGEVTVPMSSLSRGVYYITVWYDNNKIFTKKILRE